MGKTAGTSFGQRFGALVARKREECGWSFAQLADKVYPADGLAGESRKSDVQKLEVGKSKKPNAATILKYRLALALTQDEIDTCRTAEEIPLAHFADTLFEVIATAIKQIGVPDDLAAALVETRAKGNPNDFDGALREIRRALEDYAADRAHPLSNLGEAVDQRIAQVNALNDTGDLAGGTKALDAILAAQKDKSSEAEQGVTILLRKRVAQAVLERSVPDAVAFTLERLDRDVPDRAERFDALRAEQNVWYVRGRDMGLGFDLEVSIVLAGECQTLAVNSVQHLAAGIILGTSMVTLGEREIGTERLVRAIDVYETALNKHSGGDINFDWAMAHNGIGAALFALGRKERSVARYEKSLSAYRAALVGFTRDSFHLQWAMIQNNLGNTLGDLGRLTNSRAYLELAVDSYRAALDEYTKEKTPDDRRTTLNNLGNALTTLGVWDLGTTRFDEALAAYNEALLLSSKEVVPLHWATWRENMAWTELRLAEHTATTRPRRHWLRSLKHVNAALEVYDKLEIPSYYEKANGLRDHLLAALSGP